MIFNYPLESVINHDLIKNRGSTLFSLYTIWFCNSVILIWLRCLWKLQRGYLKLKLSWFPKFLSKTVAKLHLVLLCLGKHYIDAQRSRSIFPLSYNEFSNKSAFLFSFGGANKKVFFLLANVRVQWWEGICSRSLDQRSFPNSAGHLGYRFVKRLVLFCFPFF